MAAQEGTDAVKQVLGDFRTRFIETVDADAIVFELKNKDIINDGDFTTITTTPGSTQKNSILHDCLLQKCDEDALMEVCEVIINVKGNPKMKGLGKKMKSALEGPAPQAGAQPLPPQTGQPPPQVVKTDLGSSAVGDTGELSVTKVVTLRDLELNPSPPADPSPPAEEWVVKCFRVADCSQELSPMHEWELTDTSHVLMHIDVPNQQLYHLPLLITPIHCVYLVTFDLQDGKKALETIHRAMKHISAFVSYNAESLLDNCSPSKVLLVGTYKEELTDSQRSQFGKELHESLKKYDGLIVKPAHDEEFWAVKENCIGPHNASLFEAITHRSCRPQVSAWQCMKYDEKLRQTYHRGKKAKAILKSKLPNYSSADTEKFLTFLHDYGFLVYCPYEELLDEDTTVVLEPQYLCQQFSKAQQLSKKDKGKATVADLFSQNTELQFSVQRKWFEKFCVHMGLVIEQPIQDGKNFVFVFSHWLRSETVSKELPLPACSVAPLLVMFGLPDEGDYYILPRFFAAFASMFPKHLQKKCKQALRVRVNSLPSVQQSHIVVEWDVRCSILVVEQESCIEIRFQLLCNSECTAEAKLQKLQTRCQTIDEAVAESATIAAANFKLPSKECVQYGFYHKCGKIGARIADDYETSLRCCCDWPETLFTPMQKIWFQNVDCKVRLQPHEADKNILELVEGPDPLQHTLPPQPKSQQQATPDRGLP